MFNINNEWKNQIPVFFFSLTTSCLEVACLRVWGESGLFSGHVVPWNTRDLKDQQEGRK